MKKWTLCYRNSNSDEVMSRGFNNLREAEHFMADVIKSGGQLQELKHDGKQASLLARMSFDARVNQKLRAN
jgi:hypothetical protein